MGNRTDLVHRRDWRAKRRHNEAKTPAKRGGWYGLTRDSPRKRAAKRGFPDIRDEFDGWLAERESA